MSYMSNLEIELREIISNYKANNLPITLAAKDVAHRHNISLAQVYLLIDQLLQEEDNTHMTFKGNKDMSSSYVEKRMKGEGQ